MNNYLKRFKTFELVTSRDELNSTRDRRSSLVEPALMELEDYLELLGANKQHPSSAYQFNLSDSEKFENKDLYDYLNTKKHGSVSVKYYIRNDKEHNNSYVKTNDEGHVVRDTKGMAVYLNNDELKEKDLLNKYDKNIVAIHNDIIVGSAQDEWGCVLVYVVDEFKGIGIGQELVEYYRKIYPDKVSGGTTEGGYKNLIKYYKYQVKLYLRNGIYSDMVKNGDISKEKVKKITDSVKGTKYTKYKDTIYSKYLNVDSYNKAFVYSDSDIVLINDKILEFYNDYDGTGEDFYERFVFGHSHIVDYENNQRLYFIEGKSNKDIESVIKHSLCFINSYYKKDFATYFVTENTSDIVRKFFKSIYKNTDFKVEWYEKDRCKIYFDKCDSLKKDLLTGTKWFYSLDDKYDEIKNQLIENVYSTFE